MDNNRPGPSKSPESSGKRPMISTLSGSDEPSPTSERKPSAGSFTPPNSLTSIEGIEEFMVRCPEDIVIPANLVGILKEFTKSAIRTQPRDLLAWTKAYFMSKANGDPPPVKDRFEFPMAYSKIGLTIGLLRVMRKQLRGIRTAPKEELLEIWRGLCLEEFSLDDFIECGNLNSHDIDLRKLFALMCKTLATTIEHTMDIVCEVYTEELDGKDALIPFEIFWESYLAIAEFDDLNIDENLFEFLSGVNGGMIGPAIIKSSACPSLDSKPLITSTVAPSANDSGTFYIEELDIDDTNDDYPRIGIQLGDEDDEPSTENAPEEAPKNQ